MVKEHLHDVLPVFAKFHIVRHLMDAANQVRKEKGRDIKGDNLILLEDLVNVP